MLDRVLVPCDGTGEGRLLVRFVAGLRSLGVGRAVVCHVVDDSGLEGPVIAAKVDAARGMLADYVMPLREAGVDTEVRIPAGDAERQILALASEASVDAIVTGAHSRSVTDAIFAGGSLSERIALGAGRPVLMARVDLLRNQEDPARLAETFAMRILVPVDFSESSGRALDVVWSLPPKAVGCVRLLHVVADGADDAPAEAAVRELAQRGRAAGFTVQAVLGHGSPERAVLSEIDESRVTGVVMGTRGRQTLAGALLGSVSLTIVRQASCPVMVVS